MNCPECFANIPWSLEQLEDGEVISCSECEQMLEVVFLAEGGVVFDPITFADDEEIGDIEW